RAGRPYKKDRLMLPPDALAEVCTMRDKLRELMSNSKPPLNPDDSATAVVYWRALDEPPVVRLLPVHRETELKVLHEMHGKYAAVTIGVLFALKDHERGIIRRWAQPFLLSPDA